MKKLLAILLLTPALLSAQQSDSIEISTGGAKARIGRPPLGQQSTVLLKDSLSQLEIRISNPHAITASPDSSEKKKSTKYFSQFSLGTLLATDLSTVSHPKYLYGMEYFSFTVKKINPGLEAAVSLRKGSYRIADKLYFQSGINYRFMMFSADAEYSSYQYDLAALMEMDSSKPIVTADYYRRDTVDVGMRKFINQISVPVMLQYRLSSKLAISLGMALDFSFTRTQLDNRGLDGDLYKEIQFSDPDYPLLQLRPQFSLDIGPFGIYISKDLASSKFGYGNAEKKSTRFTHIGISYNIF